MNEDNNGDYRCKKDDVLAVTNEISITEDKIITVAENNISEQLTTMAVDQFSLLNGNAKVHSAKRNYKIDLLVLLFGIGSWIGVASLFVQLQALVATAPEGYSLPSHIVIIVQIANIGPILYTLIQKYTTIKLNDSYLIYIVYTIGCLAFIFITFFYEQPQIVDKQKRSIALYITSFCFAFVGCTSAVLFMPYMKRFRDVYLITHLFGEGLSGLIPSIIALIQGARDSPKCIQNNSIINGTEFMRHSQPPRFGLDKFFMIVFIIQVISFIAFILLHNLKMCRNEYVVSYVSSKYNRTEKCTTNNFNNVTVNCDNKETAGNMKRITSAQYKSLLILMAVIFMFKYGIFTSVQSYSTLPYGNVAYHLTLTLSSIAGPVLFFISAFIKNTSIPRIITLTILSTIISVYVMTTSVLGPASPLVGTLIGQYLIVFCWTTVCALLSYIRLSITAIFRLEGGKSLIWIGAVQRIGALIGGVFIFYLINFVDDVFKSHDPCKN